MTETRHFVGLQPAGAHALIKAMRNRRQTLHNLLRPISLGVSDAGEDIDPDAAAAGSKLVAYDNFLRTWIPDLEWRTKYIEDLEDVDPSSTEMAEAEVPFLTVEESKKAGTNDGKDLARLWEEYQNAGVADHDDAREALLAKLSELSDRQTDPLYAGALLDELGGDTLMAMLEDVHAAAPVESGETPDEEMARLREHIGALAEMYAAADRAGTLSDSVREDVLNADPYLLSVFVRLGPHTDEFATDVAERILNADSESHRAYTNLMTELADHPEVMRELLANEEYAKKIFDSFLINGPVGEDYQRALAGALQAALGTSMVDHPALGGGTDPETAAAWAGIMKAFEDPDIRRAVGRSPELAQTLATGIKPYLPFLAALQGDESTVDVDIPMPDGHAPDVTTDDARNLFAAIGTDPDARETLIGDYQDYVQGLDMGSEHPFENEETRAEFLHDVAQAGGLATLIIRGLSQSGLDTEELRDTAGALLMTPVDAVLSMGKGAGVAANKAWELSGNREDVERWLGELVSGEPAKASEALDKLVNIQMEAIEANAEEAGIELTDEDKQLIRYTIQGSMFDGVVEALEDREG